MAPTSEDEPETVQFDGLTAANDVQEPAPQSMEMGPGTIIPRNLVPGLDESFVPFGPLGSGPSFPGGIAHDPGSSPNADSIGSFSPPVIGTTSFPPAVPPIILPPRGGGAGGTETLPPLIVPDVLLPPGDEFEPSSTPPETTPVPEPGTLLLVGGGLATWLARRRNSAGR
jgi:hypothetical protein